MALNRHASVLVSPRSTGGNTPLKVYEQLSSGIAIVATNIHSHTQVLEPTVAFLVKPDAESFAAGLVRALEDTEETQSKIEAAQRLFRERYSREIYVRKVARLLEPFTACAE